MSKFLEAALRYAALGWRVFPLRVRGKEPIIDNGSTGATNDINQIRTWWARWPNANIGLATGHQFFILDVDPRHNGDESLESLELNNGSLPPTLQQISGGGGQHRAFRIPPGLRIPNSQGKIANGLDIKGAGGYIVAWPSIHPDTGRQYEWDGIAEFEQQPILECPQWLIDLAINNDGKPFEVPDKISKGKQHSTLVRAAGLMRGAGFTPEEIFAAIWVTNITRCEEPGPEKNIRQIAESAGKWAQGDRLNGNSNGRAAGHLSDPDIQAEIEIPWTERLSVARQLVTEALTTPSHKLYGSRDNPAPYLVALANVGELEQKAARRLLKEKFKSDFVAKEWDLQLAHEKSKLVKQDQQKTPYILNSEGGLRVGVANAITMIAALPVAWNSFSCRAFLTSAAPWGSEGNWTDYDDIKAAEWCQHQGLHIPPTVAMDASLAVARDRKPYYHPVTEYLKSITWDGASRLNTWMRDFLGAPDSDYTRAVAAKWAISAVRRVFDPGCQADYTIVLEGTQGKRKSTALRTLVGPEWFSDDITDIGSKDSAIQLQGKWVVELAELDAFRRAEITTIKAWLVRREDHFRPPYGRRAEDFPRQNVFAASTNKEDWGMDDTGLRRFWPVRCGEIKIEALAAARDQLWAEAYQRHLNKESSYLNDLLEAKASHEQHDRQEIDPWTTIIEPWVDAPKMRGGASQTEIENFQSSPAAIYLPEILSNCLNIPEKDWNKSHKDRVTRVLRILGYIAKRAPRSKDDPKAKRPEYWSIPQ